MVKTNDIVTIENIYTGEKWESEVIRTTYRCFFVDGIQNMKFSKASMMNSVDRDVKPHLKVVRTEMLASLRYRFKEPDFQVEEVGKAVTIKFTDLSFKDIKYLMTWYKFRISKQTLIITHYGRTESSNKGSDRYNDPRMDHL